MKIINYQRGARAYDNMACHIEAINNFYDFPATLLIFGESLRTSTLMTVDDQVFFRRLNKNIQLLTWQCGTEKLLEAIDRLKIAGFKISSRGYMFNDQSGLETRPYETEYYVRRGVWDVDKVVETQTARQRKKMNAMLRKFPDEYYKCGVDKADAIALHDLWIKEAASRHFMVVKGYSQRFIERYYDGCQGLCLWGIRNQDDVLYGLVGYEVFGQCAQMMVMKHRMDVDYFSRWMWMLALKHIFDNNPDVEMIFCGASADELKRQLRFQSTKAFKVVL